MAKKKANTQTSSLIADNKKARFNYHFEEEFDAGIVLTGTEVKSLREGKIQFADSHIEPRPYNDTFEMFLVNCHISHYSHASEKFNHNPTRERKLLLNKREINKLTGQVQKKGLTIVPVKMFWHKGNAKIKIALAKGKTNFDKRKDEQKRDWDREKHRLMKEG